MIKFYKYVVYVILILLSFYMTDEVSKIILNKNNIVKEIKAVGKDYEEKEVNAIIDNENNTIIPGKYGKKINVEESYLNMHDFKAFNVNYFVYKYIKPKVSLENEIDKYIISGNKQNRKVSIIVIDNNNIVNYLTNKKIKFDIIANKDTNIQDNFEYINGSYDNKSFNYVQSKLKNNLCIKDYSNIKLCLKNRSLIFDPQIILNQDNIQSSLNKINCGSIILISTDIDLNYIDILLKNIEYKDLKIVNLSELVNEKIS